MLVESTSKVQRKVLIHLPNNPGGKVNYFTAIKDHFENDVSFFLCGKQGRKESKFVLFKRMLKDYWDFYRLLKKGNFELLLTNPTLDPKSFFRDSIFTLLGYVAGVKTVVFWHGWRWQFEQKLVRKIKPYFRWTYGTADAMIFLAKEFSQQTLSYGYRKPTYLETTVVEDNILDFVNDHKLIARQAAQEKKHFTILFLSRVEIAKGIYELLDSFQQLQKKYPELILNIAGEGKESENTKQYVKEKGILNVNFLGWIKGKQKAQAFHEADLYVLPSYSEGMPISLLEAMASGLPVVTTDVGGIKDFFEAKKMGALIKPKDAADLAQKLENLISAPDNLKQIGAYNEIYAQKRFTPKQVSQRIEAIYEEVIART